MCCETPVKCNIECTAKYLGLKGFPYGSSRQDKTNRLHGDLVAEAVQRGKGRGEGAGAGWTARGKGTGHIISMVDIESSDRQISQHLEGVTKQASQNKT